MRKVILNLCLVSMVLASPTALANDSDSNPSIQELQSLLAKDSSQQKMFELLVKMILKGDLNGVKFLIDKGAPLSWSNTGSALMLAVEEKQTAIVEFLLAKGANVHERYQPSETAYDKSQAGETALFLAMAHPNPTIARLLLKKGAEVDVKNAEGLTPLFYAARDGNTAMLDLLVSQGAKLDYQDKKGNTILTWAFAGGQFQNIEYLLSQGVDTKHLNQKGELATFAVFEGGGWDCDVLSKIFYEYEYSNIFDINHQNHDGNTLIHLAFLQRSISCAESFFDKGIISEINFSLQNKAGKTPVHLLLEYLHGQASPAEVTRILQALSQDDDLAPLRQTFSQVAQLKAQTSSLKSNMHTLQTMVETYAVDYSGEYPKDLASLYQAASQAKAGYWKGFLNPFTGRDGLSASMLDYHNQQEPGLAEKGKVVYKPVYTDGKVTSYQILGVNHLGQWLKDGETVFSLSNG